MSIAPCRRLRTALLAVPKGTFWQGSEETELGHLATDHIVIMDKMPSFLGSEHRGKDGQELLCATCLEGLSRLYDRVREIVVDRKRPHEAELTLNWGFGSSLFSEDAVSQ